MARRSNDNVVCFGASRNLQQWLEQANSGKIGFGQENSHILSHCLFRFKLTFRSRFVLGCYETCAEMSTKSSSAINRAVWNPLKERNRGWTRWNLDEISGSLVQQVIFPQNQHACLGREVWLKTERASNRSRLQQTADNVLVHLYEHFHVQGKPRLR